MTRWYLSESRLAQKKETPPLLFFLSDWHSYKKKGGAFNFDTVILRFKLEFSNIRDWPKKESKGRLVLGYQNKDCKFFAASITINRRTAPQALGWLFWAYLELSRELVRLVLRANGWTHFSASATENWWQTFMHFLAMKLAQLVKS